MKSRFIGRFILFVLMAFLSMLKVEAQELTISNNLLYDATLTPNLRLGFRLDQHWSAGFTAGYRPWPTDDEASRKWRHLLLSPDVRYWKDSVNVGHFFGANLIYSHYNVADIDLVIYNGVKGERRQGDMGALGIFYGYSWVLGRHWNLEALAGIAVGYAKYDEFECGHCGTKIGDDKKVFLLPQLGLNIVFNIPGRPKQPKEKDDTPSTYDTYDIFINQEQ